MRSKAFSLIELLVVVAIIVALIAIMLPSLAHARACAQRTRSSSNVRQLLIGYTSYQTEFDGQVIYGYTPSMIFDGSVNQPVKFTSPLGYEVSGPPAQRYVWRLVPYVGNIWEILQDYGPAPAKLSPDDPLLADKIYKVSVFPTYGINATFVGGDSTYGFTGFKISPGQPVVFRATDVRDASNLIVFSETVCMNNFVLDSNKTGLSFLTPPRISAIYETWKVADGKIKGVDAGLLGVPSGRYLGNLTVTGFFDGHVEPLKPQELADMRHWYNWASGPDSAP